MATDADDKAVDYWVISDEALRGHLHDRGVAKDAVHRWVCPCTPDCDTVVLYGEGVNSRGYRTLWVTCSVTVDRRVIPILGLDGLDTLDSISRVEPTDEVQAAWFDALESCLERGLDKPLAIALEQLIRWN